MSAWQPIETAPRDGSNFLAIGGVWHGLPYVLRYSVNEHGWYSDRPWYAPQSTSRLYAHVPTHWQPLPEPPAQP